MASEADIFVHIQANITNVLLAAANPVNKAAADAAVQQYQQWESQHFPMWLTALAFELADESKDAKSRDLAGIMLRGALQSREEGRMVFVLERWQQVPLQARSQIHAKLLGMMADVSTTLRHRAAEAVAQIATLDIPTDSWKGIVPLLTSALTTPGSSDLLKEASLIALGEICFGVAPAHLERYSEDVLFAIITGMDSPHKELQLVATKALNNALSFSSKNFQIAEQRRSIMALVMKTAESENEDVRLAAYECLVTIATAFYEELPESMQSGLWALSLNAIRSDLSEKVVNQAIEFWSTICEEEMSIFKENRDAEETGSPQITCHNFIKGAVESLAEPLFATLSKGEVDPDLETWTVAAAASGCITLIANTLGDEAVRHFVNFVPANITQQEERLREAAVLCFGSLMDGPSTEVIGPVIVEALPVLYDRMADESHLVKHTTAWCIARIASYHPGAVVNDLANFLMAICNGLKDVPSVAAACADAVDNLAAHVDEDARDASPLNEYLGNLFEALTQSAEREDSEEASLRLSAYAAVRSLVNATPDSSVEMINHVIQMYAPRLRALFSGVGEKDLECEMVGILAACTRRLGPAIEPVAQSLMELYVDLLKVRDGVSEIYQDVFMGVGALASALGPSFAPLLQPFSQYLLVGLNQWTDPDLCNHSVQLVSALCFALSADFAPYCEEVVNIFVSHLKQETLDATLGPVLVNIFADLAFALNEEFAPYLATVMDILNAHQTEACRRTDQMSDYDEIDLTNQWRSALLSTYTFAVQSCAAKHQRALMAHMGSMLRVMTFIADDHRRDDQVNRYVCGLLYDLAVAFPNAVSNFKPLAPFLNYCLQSQSSEDKTKEAAQTTIELFGNL